MSSSTISTAWRSAATSTIRRATSSGVASSAGRRIAITRFYTAPSDGRDFRTRAYNRGHLHTGGSQLVKLSCTQENLARGLGIVGRAVAVRSPLPVTSNVLLATDDARLKLAATNLDIATTCWVPARVEEDGATTVPARLLGEFVNSLPNDRVDMKLNERQRSLNLKCGPFEANIKGIDADEFPPIPPVGSEAPIVLDPKV